MWRLKLYRRDRERTLADTAIQRHTPFAARLDLYIRPSLPFFTDPHILLAGNAGLLRLEYFFVYLRETFDFRDRDRDRDLERAIVYVLFCFCVRIVHEKTSITSKMSLYAILFHGLTPVVLWRLNNRIIVMPIVSPITTTIEMISKNLAVLD